MGCCSSTSYTNSNISNSTFNSYYVATSEQRHCFKRSFSSHISNGSSSGVSSTSQSRQSIFSRCNTTPSYYRNPKVSRPKTTRFTLTHNNISKNIKLLSICDDFSEAEKMKQQQQDMASFGYYSEHASSGSSVSTPSQPCVRRTSDISLRIESQPVAVNLNPSDLEMEMYMISQSHGFMMKTSSPISERRDLTIDAVSGTSPSSHSYQIWANYLQSTPTYMLHNFIDIPEAIAGYFIPIEFSAFTDLDVIRRAAKTLKLEIRRVKEIEEDEAFYEKQIPKPSKLTHAL